MQRLQLAVVAVLLAYESVHDTIEAPELATAMRKLEYALPAEARAAFEATLADLWATDRPPGEARRLMSAESDDQSDDQMTGRRLS